jgi:hypothetical protein
MSKLPIFIITETEPTPLLRDFATFTQYLRTHHIVLTRVNEFIPGAGKLFQKVSGKGSRLVLKTTGRLQAYEELKHTEKYFFLLETFWVDADWEKLNVEYLWQSPLYSAPDVLEYLSKRQPGEEIQLKGEEASDMAQMLFGWNYFLLYFAYFGFWEVTRDTARRDLPKRFFRAESITPSTFGVTLARVLSETRNLFYWNLPNRRKNGELGAIPGSPFPGEDSLALFEQEPKRKKSKAAITEDKGRPGESFFLPFVPLSSEGELQKTLPREGVKFVDGTYVFKVALAKNLWRRIEISADQTLLELHRAIQKAYNFDDDHLYSFFMDGKAWSHESFTSPYDEEGPWADDVRIGELGLFIGQNILYLFDYGDEWHFQVELEEIRTEGLKPREPKISEKKGKAPEQYGDYEE